MGGFVAGSYQTAGGISDYRHAVGGELSGRAIPQLKRRASGHQEKRTPGEQ